MYTGLPIWVLILILLMTPPIVYFLSYIQMRAWINASSDKLQESINNYKNSQENGKQK